MLKKIPMKLHHHNKTTFRQTLMLQQLPSVAPFHYFLTTKCHPVIMSIDPISLHYNHCQATLLHIVLQHVDPLPGNDHEISNYTTATAK